MTLLAFGLAAFRVAEVGNRSGLVIFCGEWGLSRRGNVMSATGYNGFHKTDRELLRRLVGDSRLHAAELRVMLLALLAEREPGDKIELGCVVTSRQAGMTERTVDRAKRTLVDLGYLQESGKGKRSATLYEVTTPDVQTGGPQTGGLHTGGPQAGGTPDTQTGGFPVVQTGGAAIIHLLETRKQGDCAEQDKKPSCSVGSDSRKPQKPKVIKTDTAFVIPDAIRQAWTTAFPGVDIDREAAKAVAWCRNNPRKAPKKDYGRFLHSWLNRAEPVEQSAHAQDDGSLGYLAYKLEHIEAKYGEDIARRYDAEARRLKSTDKADTWLKREIECRPA